MLNKNQSGMVWLVILAFVLVVAGAAVFYIKKDNQSADKAGDDQTTSQASDQPAKVDEGSLGSQSNVEQVKLLAVGNYSGNGTASRSFENGNFKHSVEANIGDPSSGKFYEGWIVKSGDFISTGKLSKKSEGLYVLAYTSDQNMMEYDKVVITEETEANGLDNKPEAHVLEGSF